MCVYDSTWEATEAYQLEHSPHVAAWAKNDHLGFEVLYTYRGVVHKYLPDFLLRLADGRMLILEVKGQDDDEQRTKRQFLDEWVRAVNTHGGFGAWAWAVSRRPTRPSRRAGLCPLRTPPPASTTSPRIAGLPARP